MAADQQPSAQRVDFRSLSARALAESDPGTSWSRNRVLAFLLLAAAVFAILFLFARASDVDLLSIQFAATGHQAESIESAWVEVTGSEEGLDEATPGAVAQAVIDSWRLRGVVEEVAMLLVLDTALLVIYGFAVFHLCLRVAHRAQSRHTKALLYWLARGAVAAACADLLENLATGAMIYFGSPDWLATTTTALAVSKWILILSALGTALFQAAFNAIRSRFQGRWKFLPQPFEVPPQTAYPTRRPPQDPVRGRVGIASSGGGIRSAAYNLGALQALQRRSTDGSPPDANIKSVYGEAHTHAAVSGGAYIAAAFKVSTEPNDLRNRAPYRRLSPEETHLRVNTSYLAPRFRDKFAVTIQLLLRAFSGLLLVAGVLFVIARPIGWLAGLQYFHPDPGADGLDVAIRTVYWQVALGPLAVVLALNAVRTFWGSTRVGGLLDKRIFPFQTLWLAAGILALLVLVIIPGTPSFVRWAEQAIVRITSTESGSSSFGEALSTGNVVAIASAVGVLGWAVSILQPLLKRPGTIPRLANTVAAIIAPTALLVGGLSIAVGGHRLGVTWDPRLWQWNPLPEAFVAVVVAGVLAAAFLGLDVTDWTLNKFYRDRLAATFGSLPDSPGESAAPKLSDLNYAPQLVVCAAANVSDGPWAPIGRRSVSFVFDAEEAGIPDVCMVPITHLEKAMEHRSQPLDVMAAVAISGAAISPGMGRRTNRSLTALLTLAGIRLGVWIPNPVWLKSNDPRRADSPWREKVRLTYFFKEMFGLFRYDDRYLYVTDGGHWDNLGVVELLRRGCTSIYVFDASGDSVETFNTLGESLAYARADLGIAVDIKPEEMRPESAKKLSAKRPFQRPNLAPTDHVTGRIRFLDHETGEVAEGYIVVCKATVIEKTPWAVKAYHEKYPKFPNHSTTDQLFDGDRFDAYQALGEFTAERGVKDLAIYETLELSWWERAQAAASGKRNGWVSYLQNEIDQDLDRLEPEQQEFLRALFGTIHTNDPGSTEEIIAQHLTVRGWSQDINPIGCEMVVNVVVRTGHLSRADIVQLRMILSQGID